MTARFPGIILVQKSINNHRIEITEMHRIEIRPTGKNWIPFISR